MLRVPPREQVNRKARCESARPCCCTHLAGLLPPRPRRVPGLLPAALRSTGTGTSAVPAASRDRREPLSTVRAPFGAPLTAPGNPATHLCSGEVISSEPPKFDNKLGYTGWDSIPAGRPPANAASRGQRPQPADVTMEGPFPQPFLRLGLLGFTVVYSHFQRPPPPRPSSLQI